MSRSFRAPGRVNLIGEHTDYNLGFVLPVALDLACFISTTPSDDGRLSVYSEQQNQALDWEIGAIPGLQPRHHWTDYVIGVARELIGAGYPIPPLSLRITSTVPEGSGLSSSAALEVAGALALLDGRTIDRLELAKLCQRAEIRFVGMPCGIMDQYISLFGREHAAIRIDCRSLEHETVTLPGGVEFLAVNTMVKHALASSAYRRRTEECAEAARIAGVPALRDLRPEQLYEVLPKMPPEVAKRARHVVTEDQRVDEFVAASRRGDLERMGQLFVASHRSLQHDYEVSCPELDFLVDTALEIEGVYGARMTGGGFGGCMVAMLRPGAVDRFRQRIVPAYQQQFSAVPQIYPCKPSVAAAETRGQTESTPSR